MTVDTTSRLVLALDQGGHATRAVVHDADGSEVARAEVAIETQRPRPGWVEHEPRAMLASLQGCLDRIADRLGADLGRLDGAALATQRSSVVCWSRTDRTALSPVLSWQDVRAASVLDTAGLDGPEVHAITGLRLSPHYGASKLRWCLSELPAVRDALARGGLAAGPLASWLVHAATDGACFAVDPCNASRTLLWNVTTRDWSPRLLDAFAIPRAILPRCQANRADWDTLIVGGRRVALGVVTGDQSAVPFAFDGIGAGDAFLTLGTGAFLQLIEGPAPTRCAGLLNSVIRQDGASIEYALEGTINGAGAALASLAQHEQVDEHLLLEQLPQWLSTTPAPPLFVNAVGGLAAPFWKPTASSGFVGDGDLAGRAVAVIESIAFLVQANLEAMRAGGRPVRRIIAVGGLARLDGLLARIAALAGVPVQRAARAEATAYGAARLAAPALPPLAIGASFMPDPGLRDGLLPRYAATLERWRAL